jgi:hypothetical protein
MQASERRGVASLRDGPVQFTMSRLPHSPGCPQTIGQSVAAITRETNLKQRPSILHTYNLPKISAINNNKLLKYFYFVRTNESMMSTSRLDILQYQTDRASVRSPPPLVQARSHRLGPGDYYVFSTVTLPVNARYRVTETLALAAVAAAVPVRGVKTRTPEEPVREVPVRQPEESVLTTAALAGSGDLHKKGSSTVQIHN